MEYPKAHSPDPSFPANPDVEVRTPNTAKEWAAYYELRWQVLRAPWNQPRGSERDEFEESSIHLGAWRADDPHPLAIGRLHFNSPKEAQIRFMAVQPKHQKSGLGSSILRALEHRASVSGAERLILNARDAAEPFYSKHGYAPEGAGATLFGAVKHLRMCKHLTHR